MDLRPIAAVPSDDEREAVDAVLGAESAAAPSTTSLALAQSKRHLLLPALHAIQARAGWVSPGALGYAAQRLDVPPAEAYGVASFYSLFSLHERPPRVLHVCDDIACKTRGADALCAELDASAGPAGQTKDGAMWLRSPCLGLCGEAPAALAITAGRAPDERAFGRVTAASLSLALSDGSLPPPHREPLPQAGEPGLRLLARVGQGDPTSLDDYRARGGYVALRRAFELGPAGVIREVSDAKLVGRGGAAFPTGRKWEAVARAVPRPHYLICNADESEPGTFKDRILLEEDPFAIVEAMTIAGFAIGAELGFVYLRGEYPLAHERLAHAIEEARAKGLLGKDIFGRGLSFDLTLRKGAGAYICGEETALMNSIEGLRGEPRNKPPFPVDVGLFGKPTAINNVETLANVPLILREGAAAHRALGTEGSPGTRLFCLSGAIVRPGLYEVPMGITLRALLEKAGGLPAGRSLQAVLLGGAAGTFVGPDDLELPLTFEDTRRAGATLGSGVVLVFDDATPLGPILQRIAGFFRDESCGQCVPCRIGTVRQEELVARLARNAPLGSLESERALLAELGQVMRDASICGLGQTASSAIESAFRKLPVYRGDSR